MDYRAILKSIQESLTQMALEAKKKTATDTLQPISVKAFQDARIDCPKCAHDINMHNFFPNLSGSSCNGEIKTSVEIGEDGFKRIKTELDSCTCDLTRLDVKLNLEEPPSA